MKHSAPNSLGSVGLMNIMFLHILLPAKDVSNIPSLDGITSACS